jgi:AcrR family transcriptional regulator
VASDKHPSGKDEDLGSAARALTAAVSALTRVVGQGMVEAKNEVNEQLADALRDASTELAGVYVVLGGRTDKKKRARTDRRDARADKTRARLIEAASTVFAEKGYEGASVGDVAAEAGYTKGAVYAHFRNKEDLLLAIAESLLADDDQRVTTTTSARQVFCDPSDDPDALRRTLLTLEIYTYAVRHPAAQPRLGPLVAHTWDQMATLLATARGGEGAAPSQDDKDTALVLLAVHTFSQMLGSVTGDDEVHSAGARIIDRLLSPDGGLTAP